MKRHKTNYLGVYYRTGQSAIQNRSERIYYIAYRKDGKLIEEKVGRQYRDNMTPAKANRIRALRIEGKELSNKQKREIKAKIHLKKNVWTIRNLWQEFYYQKTEDGLKSIQIEEWRYDKYLDTLFGDKEPKDLTVKEIDDFKNKLSKDKKPATVRQYMLLLQRIINFGFKKQLIPRLHFKIEMPTVNNMKTEMLTKDQLKRLLEVLDNNHNQKVAGIMKLALFTGMRKGEIFNLKWDDVDFENGFIYIKEPKSGQLRIGMVHFFMIFCNAMYSNLITASSFGKLFLFFVTFLSVLLTDSIAFVV